MESVDPPQKVNTQCQPLCNTIGGFIKALPTQEDIEKTCSKYQDDELKRKNEGLFKSNDPKNYENDQAVPKKEEYLDNLRPGADGKVDWTPLAEMTGTRPAVTQYSLSRYSLPEWTARTDKLMADSNAKVYEANVIDFNSRVAMCEAFGSVDYVQDGNNRRLKEKAREVFRWKTEVDLARQNIVAEVERLEIERQRMKAASRTLMLPEAISKECLDLRCKRPIEELVTDIFEVELKKEMGIVNTVRATLKSTLEKVEEQLKTNKRVKHRIETDCNDKQTAYDIDCENIGLNVKSNKILFRAGAAKYPEYSASLEEWQYYCQESLMDCETERQKSVDLRGTINSILTKGGRNLRLQGDKTDAALAETVVVKQALLTKLKETLHTTIQKIADVETLMANLREAIRKLDAAMKLAQNRLENRNLGRSRAESVRDEPENGLLYEIKKIHESVAGIRAQMIQAEAVRKELIDKRLNLEKDIAGKLEVLHIDRDRCGIVRSHFPSASELAGF